MIFPEYRSNMFDITVEAIPLHIRTIVCESHSIWAGNQLEMFRSVARLAKLRDTDSPHSANTLPPPPPQNQFIVDEVSNVIKQAIEQTIGGNAYQHDKVNNWTGAVVENCLSVLTKQQKPYKYIGESSSKKLFTLGPLCETSSFDFHFHTFLICCVLWILFMFMMFIHLAWRR